MVWTAVFVSSIKLCEPNKKLCYEKLFETEVWSPFNSLINKTTCLLIQMQIEKYFVDQVSVHDCNSNTTSY